MTAAPGGEGGGFTTRQVHVPSCGQDAMTHQEVVIKVNAWVDEGVVALVRALNVYPQIVTTDSCECDPNGQAFVMFTTQDLRGLYETAEMLAERLSEMDSCPATLSLEWWYGGTAPSLTLRCPPGAVDAVAYAISDSVTPVGTSRLMTRSA